MFVFPYPVLRLMLVNRLTTAQLGLQSNVSFCPYFTRMNIFFTFFTLTQLRAFTLTRIVSKPVFERNGFVSSQTFRPDAKLCAGVIHTSMIKSPGKLLSPMAIPVHGRFVIESERYNLPTDSERVCRLQLIKPRCSSSKTRAHAVRTCHTAKAALVTRCQ